MGNSVPCMELESKFVQFIGQLEISIHILRFIHIKPDSYTLVIAVTGSSEVTSGCDNRDIMDDGASQELTEESITEMKGQGASGKVYPHRSTWGGKVCQAPTHLLKYSKHFCNAHITKN